ncbi:putative acetyltransferase [Oxalobacteraceae bacterium IMCC9480]|nr:putative acetyltransferase [Oxalobacteraceae bacterium IMCC9480]NDP59143.1 GNAT family N-acetyltransferase [Oxalobacteraceae bacterium]
MSAATVQITLADYADPADARDVIAVLDAYARDPFGGAEPLAAHVRRDLIAALAARAGAFSVLARVDGVAVGLANCFEGFSTFSCAPLINIHDMMVLAPYRGQRLAQQLMQHVEQVALERGCCKITLEVLEGNRHAQLVYRKMGYAGYQLDAEYGDALMWQKKLSA